MSTANQVNIIFLEETLNHRLSKRVRYTTVILAPGGLALLGVRPKQVAEETILGHFRGPGNLLELRDGDEFWGEPAVHAKNFIVNEGRDRHTVENVLELFPEADAVPIFALIVEAINTVDLAALVVASEEEEVFLELDFVGEQENDGLEGLLATVDVISQEKVVSLGRVPSVLKQPEQVGELTMHVTYTRVSHLKKTYRRF